jgi:hypothetical protein
MAKVDPDTASRLSASLTLEQAIMRCLTGGPFMPTLGEYRVGLDFNPSGDMMVNKIKRAIADERKK